MSEQRFDGRQASQSAYDDLPDFEETIFDVTAANENDGEFEDIYPSIEVSRVRLIRRQKKEANPPFSDSVHR